MVKGPGEVWGSSEESNRGGNGETLKKRRGEGADRGGEREEMDNQCIAMPDYAL